MSAQAVYGKANVLSLQTIEYPGPNLEMRRLGMSFDEVHIFHYWVANQLQSNIPFILDAIWVSIRYLNHYWWDNLYLLVYSVPHIILFELKKYS